MKKTQPQQRHSNKNGFTPHLFIKKGEGFTLIEVLLVVAVLMLLGGLSVPLYNTTFLGSAENATENGVSSALWRAQNYARAGFHDAHWSVRVQSDEVIVFKGESFEERDTTFDEVFTFEAAGEIEGTREFVFQKATGLPQNEGALTFTLSNSRNVVVRVNAFGAVLYE